jgi:hypothetical protein
MSVRLARETSAVDLVSYLQAADEQGARRRRTRPRHPVGQVIRLAIAGPSSAPGRYLTRQHRTCRR